MIITPSQNATDYLEVPYGWDRTSDIDWSTPQGQVPSYFRIWIPKGRLTQISILIHSGGSQYGTACLRYGGLPGPWDDEEGPFARHGSVELDDLNSTAFQFAGPGQIVHQVWPVPFPGGGAWLYGAIAAVNLFKLQVVLRLSEVVVLPASVVRQECTLKPGTTKLVILAGGRKPKKTTVNKRNIVMEF